MKRRSSHSTADEAEEIEPNLKQPHPVDVHVGQKIRYWRSRHGFSQGDLGAEIGVTFQQMQKYENGKNRVSASRLYEIARCLRISIEEFFNDLPATDGGDDKKVESNTSTSSDYPTEIEQRRVIDAYHRLPSEVAERVVTLMQAIGSGSNET